MKKTKLTSVESVGERENSIRGHQKSIDKLREHMTSLTSIPSNKSNNINNIFFRNLGKYKKYLHNKREREKEREIYCVHNDNLLFLIFFLLWICMESYPNVFHPKISHFMSSNDFVIKSIFPC